MFQTVTGVRIYTDCILFVNATIVNIILKKKILLKIVINITELKIGKKQKNLAGFKNFVVTLFIYRTENCVAYIFIFWRERLGLIPESVKSAQVSIDLSLIKACIVCLGASRGNGLRQLVEPERY